MNLMETLCSVNVAANRIRQRQTKTSSVWQGSLTKSMKVSQSGRPPCRCCIVAKGACAERPRAV